MFADRLFTAGEQGAAEEQFQQISVEDLTRMHFRANNTSAHRLGVKFTDVEHIEIELQVRLLLYERGVPGVTERFSRPLSVVPGPAEHDGWPGPFAGGAPPI